MMNEQVRADGQTGGRFSCLGGGIGANVSSPSHVRQPQEISRRSENPRRDGMDPRRSVDRGTMPPRMDSSDELKDFTEAGDGDVRGDARHEATSDTETHLRRENWEAEAVGTGPTARAFTAARPRNEFRPGSRDFDAQVVWIFTFGRRCVGNAGLLASRPAICRGDDWWEYARPSFAFCQRKKLRIKARFAIDK